MSKLPERIILIGMPGSGKSTQGKRLAGFIGYTHLDLDKYIEEKLNKSIHEIFSEQGETPFRKIEHEALKEVCEFSNCVISCGGGTPCFYNNMQIILNSGFSIYLSAEISLLVSRIMQSKTERPLFLGGPVGNEGTKMELLQAKLEKILAEREPYFRHANLIFQIPAKQPKSLLNKVLQQFTP